MIAQTTQMTEILGDSILTGLMEEDEANCTDPDLVGQKPRSLKWSSF